MDAAPSKEKTSVEAPQNAAPDLASLTDEELLRMRICDLKLQIRGSELESRIEKFYAELAAKGIAFKPICYLGDEWFCPEGSATIAIPFYLAHPRLKKLEAKMMMEVEGDSEAWCLRLLRRWDGSVVTSNCSPKRRRLPLVVGAAAFATVAAAQARLSPKLAAESWDPAASTASSSSFQPCHRAAAASYEPIRFRRPSRCRCHPRRALRDR